MDTKTTPQARRHFLASLAALPLVGGLFAPRAPTKTAGQFQLGGEWQGRAAEGYQRFAAECPGRAAAEELLERTFT